MMHESNFSSDLLLEAKVGGFLIPEGEGGRYSVHGLDAMHDPSGDSCGKVRDQGGSIFGFIVFGMGNIEFKSVDIVLELFSRVNVGSREPVHGFLGSV